MATGPRYSVKFRRKRKGETDYNARLGLLKSGTTRLVVRRTNTRLICQLVSYNSQEDTTLLTATSDKLSSFGWKHSFKNLPAAYLSGYLVGKLAKKAKINKAILDIGLQSRSSSRLFAALKGAIDAGLEIPYDAKAIPDEKRLRGEHINEGIAKEIDAVKKKIDGKEKEI